VAGQSIVKGADDSQEHKHGFFRRSAILALLEKLQSSLRYLESHLIQQENQDQFLRKDGLSICRGYYLEKSVEVTVKVNSFEKLKEILPQ